MCRNKVSINRAMREAREVKGARTLYLVYESNRKNLTTIVVSLGSSARVMNVRHDGSLVCERRLPFFAPEGWTDVKRMARVPMASFIRVKTI